MPQTAYFKSDFASGQVNNVSTNLVPKSSVDLGMNVVFDYEIGSACSRLGTGIIGSQTVDGKTILGIVQHVDQADTTKNKLFATVNDSSNTNADIFDVGTGISLADDTASLKTRFLNYNGDTLRLNGTDAPKAYNSTSWITTGGVFDLANMPTGYKYAVEFLDRVYLWGKSSAPYTLAFSGLLTTGTVSWTSGNGTVEIEPEDNGGEGTGLAKVPGYVLIFKRRAMHRWNFASAFPEQLVNIGAYSQESIISAGGLCAFYSDSNENAKGFYVTNGGRPQPISHDTTRPIRKWVEAISSSATVAGWATDTTFNWSVGDLTVDGETWTNVVLRFNRLLNQWSVSQYPSQFSCFAPYVTGGVHTIVGGDDDGTILRVDKSATYSDYNSGTAATVPIQWRVRDQFQDLNTNHIKRISSRAYARGKNLEGTRINIIRNEDYTDIQSAGELSLWKKVLGYLGFKQGIDATSFSTEVVGETLNARAFLREIELEKVEVTQNYTL